MCYPLTSLPSPLAVGLPCAVGLGIFKRRLKFQLALPLQGPWTLSFDQVEVSLTASLTPVMIVSSKEEFVMKVLKELVFKL